VNGYDGTSQTILIGEKALDPSIYPTGSWFWDEPFFLGSTPGTRRGGTEVIRDEPGSDFADNWGSAHTSDAQFLFCDGSVQSLRFGSPFVKALLTPNGGEVIPEY
jgi:prepilin-type processing-associated H-X9-DG protein